MSDHRYEIRAMRYYHDCFHSYTNDLDEAVLLANELDACLSYGDDGISFIRDTVEWKDATVGNGRDVRTAVDLRWKPARAARLEQSAPPSAVPLEAAPPAGAVPALPSQENPQP